MIPFIYLLEYRQTHRSRELNGGFLGSGVKKAGKRWPSHSFLEAGAITQQVRCLPCVLLTECHIWVLSGVAQDLPPPKTKRNYSFYHGRFNLEMEWIAINVTIVNICTLKINKKTLDILILIYTYIKTSNNISQKYMFCQSHLKEVSQVPVWNNRPSLMTSLSPTNHTQTYNPRLYMKKPNCQEVTGQRIHSKWPKINFKVNILIFNPWNDFWV